MEDPKYRTICPSCGGHLVGCNSNDYKTCACGYYQGTLHNAYGVMEWVEHFPTKVA
jgi:hypothetical protein